MPVDPNAVGSKGTPAEVSWTSKDSLLYALGVGAGQADPTGAELEFTTENSKDIEQKALPTQGIVTAVGSMPSFGDFNPAMLLHGESSITIHKTFPIEGTATITGEVEAVYDKEKAALVNLVTHAADADGNPWWSTRAGLFIRGEGGWGGDRGPASDWTKPDRAADHVVSSQTRADQALLYRLNGDRNPLHSDPSFAALAGFDAPILHGLCTYGVTGRLVLHELCGGDVEQFGTFGGRYKSTVTPGDQLDVHIWDEGDRFLFQTLVGDRVVLDGGTFSRR